MTDLTGFTFETGLPWGPFMHATKFDHPITRDVPQDLFWGTNNVLGPLFHVMDAQAEILGQVVSAGGRSKPGLAVKNMGTWTSIYCAAPNIPAPVLRGMARFAGVHLYNDTDVARKTDRFTVDMAPISSALWYTGSARTVESLRRKGKR
jgi:hypothetical protein